MAQRTVLITGVAGLVGSHLAARFLSSGYQVLGIDNFLTGSQRNVDWLLENPSFRFERANVIERFDFANPWGGAFTQILHFACPASPIDFATLPEEILEVDSAGTLRALRFAKSQGAGFLLASTSEIYGDPLEHPQAESYWGNVNSLGPRACYDEAKRFSEAATMVFHRRYGLDTKIVRIFNTYGPRMRLNDGRVVPELCRQALEGKELTIHGDGSQTRSFCYVSDLVEGIFRLSESSEHLPVNIGNPAEFTINQFADALEKVLGKKLPRKYIEAREDDPRRRCPDITRAQKILAWQPKVSLLEGLKSTIAAFREELNQ